MGMRREGRELALQYLYQRDVQSPEETVVEQWKAFLNLHEKKDEAAKFARDLCCGVVEHQEAVDGKIKSYAENWELHRIAAVDRSILRLAIYELLFREDIPPVVSINEAIELAKKFSTEESGKFVNGMLDRVKKDLTRPLRTATGGPP